MKFLIIGLGNPGEQYLGTRHNIGADILDMIAKKNNITTSIERYSIYYIFKYKGKNIHCIQPTTYMNNSGKAVKYWVDTLKIKKENILVITDDISLPFGKLRLRPKGSSAGHNGLKSIEDSLKSPDYPRLKVGIGDNYYKGRQSIYVLEKFNKKEEKEIPFIMENAYDIIQSFTFEGTKNTMNKFN